MISFSGKVSQFGGPYDSGVSPSEGLALYADPSHPDLFLSHQPQGTTGAARRLDPLALYIACRWDYALTPKPLLLRSKCLVIANGRAVLVSPVDWGPHERTGRAMDLSPASLTALGIKTDDTATAFLLPDLLAMDTVSLAALHNLIDTELEARAAEAARAV